jgi:hypothetical protein
MSQRKESPALMLWTTGEWEGLPDHKRSRPTNLLSDRKPKSLGRQVEIGLGIKGNVSSVTRQCLQICSSPDLWVYIKGDGYSRGNGGGGGNVEGAFPLVEEGGPAPDAALAIAVTKAGDTWGSLTRHHDLPGIEFLQLLLRESDRTVMWLLAQPWTGISSQEARSRWSTRDGSYPAAYRNLWEELLVAITIYQQITRQAKWGLSRQWAIVQAQKKGKNSTVWLTLQDITLRGLHLQRCKKDGHYMIPHL